jgi:hypothetical protein
MLQETTAAAPAAAGGNNAAALQQMGFDHLITQLDAVGWIVFVTLMVMSLMSWYWIIINFIKNIRLRGRGDNGGQHVLGNPERAGRDPLHGRTAEVRAVLQDRPRRRPGRRAPPAPRWFASGRVAEPLRVRRPRAAPGRDPRVLGPRRTA